MTGPLLEARGVTLQYKTPRHLVTATYRVDLAVHEGDRFVHARPVGLRQVDAAQSVGGFISRSKAESPCSAVRSPRPAPTA